LHSETVADIPQLADDAPHVDLGAGLLHLGHRPPEANDLVGVTATVVAFAGAMSVIFHSAAPAFS
jgi:ABC-type Na+ efflux pump permease subunit